MPKTRCTLPKSRNALNTCKNCPLQSKKKIDCKFATLNFATLNFANFEDFALLLRQLEKTLDIILMI